MQTNAVQHLYRDSTAQVRGTFDGDREQAVAYYRRYVEYVEAHLPCRPARFLDVGCGCGWSTWLLRQAGHDAYGMDLHAHAPEARLTDPDVPYVAADSQHLPFPDEAFDAVRMYTVLEHVPNPQRALEESLRVWRPGGRLIVVGPHLLSVGIALHGALTETLRAVIHWRWERRTPETPNHPYGNTVLEYWWYLGFNLRHGLSKLFGERPVRFLMREPDPRPPFHADNDACYHCNPMDLVLWAKQTPGVRLVHCGAPDRFGARFLWPFIGGTWVVLEKTLTGASAKRPCGPDASQKRR